MVEDFASNTHISMRYGVLVFQRHLMQGCNKVFIAVYLECLQHLELVKTLHANIGGYQMAPDCKHGCKYSAFHSLSVEQAFASEEMGKDAVKSATDVAQEEQST